MKEETADKIHSAAKALREAIDEGTGTKKSIVLWGLIDEDNIATGITNGDDLLIEEVGKIMISLGGRLYNKIDW